MGRVVGLVIEPEELIEESPEGDGPKPPKVKG